MVFLMVVQCKHGPSDGALIQSLVLKILLEETVATGSDKHFIQGQHPQLSILRTFLNKLHMEFLAASEVLST